MPCIISRKSSVIGQQPRIIGNRPADLDDRLCNGIRRPKDLSLFSFSGSNQRPEVFTNITQVLSGYPGWRLEPVAWRAALERMDRVFDDEGAIRENSPVGNTGVNRSCCHNIFH
jgi:hypothetical protein